MEQRVVEGYVVLEGVPGIEITNPEDSKILWTTNDDGSWKIEWMTSHHLSVPPGTTGGVWLRFDDSNGHPLIRQPQGSPDVVVIIAIAR